MIPIRLKITGFLSYRDPVEVDFTTFELACISGQNGAGKSSLLDAITWVLFGQARKRDDTLINSASESAEVVFVFEYEQNTYRIQRILPRGKTTILEFQIQNAQGFKPLTEATSRATQACIETVLRLDYETFVNASFFLQGKADQFTQQRPTDRKRILASILGLEVWETYRERTAELRKTIESDMGTTSGRIAEINLELAEEPARKTRLKELNTDLARLAETRKVQELLLNSSKQARENLKRQQETVDKLAGQIARGTNDLGAILTRQTDRNRERDRHLAIVSNASAVEAAYQAWQTARLELEKWDKLAETFRDRERERHAPLAEIGAEQARLEQERASLLVSEKEMGDRREQLQRLENEQSQARQALADLDEQLKRRAQLEQSQTIIARFREQAGLRQAPLTEISTEQARLEQERKTLEKQADSIETQRTAIGKLRLELDESQVKLNQTEAQLGEIKELEAQIQSKKELASALKSGNERLKLEMDSLKERILKLEGTDGALCPLCGQPLNPADRGNLIANLQAEGQEKGNEFRRNRAEYENLTSGITELSSRTTGVVQMERSRLFHTGNLSMIQERIQTNQLAVSTWDEKDARRLAQVIDLLKTGNYCETARKNLVRIERELEAIGKALGVKPSTEQSIFERVEEKVQQIEAELNTLKSLEEERLLRSTRTAQLTEQINNLRASLQEWEEKGRPRLEAISNLLTDGSYALAARETLARIEENLKLLGYDTGAHDAMRRLELEGRSTEDSLRGLESARAALAPLERELEDIQTQVERMQTDLDALKTSFTAEQSGLEKIKAEQPDVQAAENALMEARECENILTRDVGAAQQKVSVLIDLAKRKASLEMQREELALQIKNHKALERAFGKDGVPALLIEQALPQIEEKANELLDRLSNGSMNVRFVTQASFKDKKRDDLRETLEIQISDGAGTRDYEMFSGGEAFRVNFAIRLALSEILARRTGARLQTLVIDEGFGSQDTQGRQRLIEAINQVKVDFAKILIITHLEELKEAFPNRIEVEKTPRGSTVRVS